MFEYFIDKKKGLIISGYTGDNMELTIPDAIDGNIVKGIDAKAFSYIDLVKVDMPDTIETIGSEAFYGCVELKEIHISEKVSKMTGNTFGTCVSLEKVNIPDAMKKTVRGLFRDSNLHELYIGSGLDAFDGNIIFKGTSEKGFDRHNKEIKLVTVKEENKNFKAADNVLYTKDGSKLIIALSDVSELTVADGTVEIAEGAFSGMVNLEKVNKPESLEIVPTEYMELFSETEKGETESDDVFHYIVLSNEKHISSVRKISGNTCKIPQGVTHIDERAFAYKSDLTEIIVPEGVIAIGDYAFRSSGLNKVVLPDSLEEIGNLAFAGTAIEEIGIGPNVKSIGYGALASNSFDYVTGTKKKLKSVKISEGNGTFYAENDCLIQRCWDGNKLHYCFTENKTAVIPSGVTEILPASLFELEAEAIYIPSSVQRISKEAFEACGKLKRLNIQTADTGMVAVIYLPQARDEGEENFVHKIFIRCLKEESEAGEIFDYRKYDSLYDIITADKDRILIAVDRLKTAVELDVHYLERYAAFLKRDGDKAVEIVIREDDVQGLSIIGEIGSLNKDNIDRFIEMANEEKKTDMVSYLMDYKNEHFRESAFDEFDNWDL